MGNRKKMFEKSGCQVGSTLSSSTAALVRRQCLVVVRFNGSMFWGTSNGSGRSPTGTNSTCWNSLTRENQVNGKHGSSCHKKGRQVGGSRRGGPLGQSNGFVKIVNCRFAGKSHGNWKERKQLWREVSALSGYVSDTTTGRPQGDSSVNPQTKSEPLLFSSFWTGPR